MNNEYDVGRAFQRIEEKLIKSMKYNLTRHLKEEKTEGMNWSMWQTEQLKALEQFKKENKSLFKNDFLNINTEIEEMIKKNFENGKLNQENKILETILKKNFRNYNKTSNASFLKINERKLNALIKESKSNFNKAEKAILRYTNDQYRQIIYNAQVYANTGSGTVEQAVDMATQDFLSKGINCIQYANGAMVNIASYARMAIRTANKRAYLEGEGQKRAEWGIHTVLVPNRGGGCPYCIKYQGKVFIDDVWSGGTAKESTETGYPLLSTAVKGKLFHPNCKDTAVTYFPGINSEVTPPTKQELEVKKQNYMNDQKMNYINRNIDKYKRLELGSIDSENAEKYHNKRLQWQEYKKQFKKNKEITFNDIEENSELDIPKIIDKTIKENNQTISKNAEDFINKNLTENDVIQEKLDNAPFTYRKADDKIVIDPTHEDIKYYNINESIIHEIVHMKDIRNNITNNNFEKLDKLLKSSKLYIDNNYKYFYNYLQKNNNNMALCDIMSALSKGSLSGDFGHLPEYWKNDTIMINELSANLISSRIVGNKGVDKLLEEIPPLKELAEECIKLWQV